MNELRWLSIPTAPAHCWIPIGMSEEDYQLLLSLLELLKDRIVSQKSEEIGGTTEESK
jgi:hypothetical protein